MKRVLVLETDPVMVFIVKAMLTKTHWRVLVRTTSDHLLPLINAFQPDVLLMDVLLMPVDGRVICQDIKLQRLYPGMRIVFYSLYAFDRRSVEDCYANAFLEKPFTRQELLQAVDPSHHVRLEWRKP